MTTLPKLLDKLLVSGYLMECSGCQLLLIACSWLPVLIEYSSAHGHRLCPQVFIDSYLLTHRGNRVCVVAAMAGER